MRKETFNMMLLKTKVKKKPLAWSPFSSGFESPGRPVTRPRCDLSLKKILSNIFQFLLQHCNVATLPPTWRCFNVLDLIAGGHLLPNTPLHLRPRSTRAGRKVKLTHLPVSNQVSFVGDKNGGAGLERNIYIISKSI